MIAFVFVGILVASLFLQQAAEDPRLQVTEKTAIQLYRLHVITVSIGGGGLFLCLLYFGFFILP